MFQMVIICVRVYPGNCPFDQTHCYVSFDNVHNFSADGHLIIIPMRITKISEDAIIPVVIIPVTL